MGGHFTWLSTLAGDFGKKRTCVQFGLCPTYPTPRQGRQPLGTLLLSTMQSQNCYNIDVITRMCYALKGDGGGHIQRQKGLLVVRLQIKDIAQRQNLNRSQLQMRAGVTMPLLNRYWNNKTKSVNLEALGKIARTLGVGVRDLFADHEEE